MLTLTLPQIVFYIFSAILLTASTMVIVSRNPVRGVLFLVLAFFASSVLWMLIQAEFLSLILIFVYVGAVMTLFLFVVMMLNIDIAPKHAGFVRYFPLGLLVLVLLVVMMIKVMGPQDFGLSFAPFPNRPAAYNGVSILGGVLYTQYLYVFELAAVILLVSIIAAISLAYRGRRGSKLQNIAEQVAVRRQDRVELIKMPVEKP